MADKKGFALDDSDIEPPSREELEKEFKGKEPSIEEK